MIPKIIHYCWFGGKEKPKSVIRCINSWKKFCPDYEIMEWNETNTDLVKDPYVKYAYENKKYAYCSDKVRLLKVYEIGGFYFDTDVEIVRSIDELLEYNFVGGFETDKFVNTGHGFGCEKKSKVLKAMIDEYDSCISESGEVKITGCPELNTKALLKCGLVLGGKTQKLEGGVMIFSPEYFNPYDDAMGKLHQTENTFSIHWYTKSAFPLSWKIRFKLSRIYHKLFGVRKRKNRG